MRRGKRVVKDETVTATGFVVLWPCDDGKLSASFCESEEQAREHLCFGGALTAYEVELEVPVPIMRKIKVKASEVEPYSKDDAWESLGPAGE